MRAAWARAARRPALVAALLYALLALAFVSPALVPGKTLSNDFLWFMAPWEGVKPADLSRPVTNANRDALFQYQPWLEHNSNELPDVPLWNPFIAAGRPYLANAQSAVFSPFSLPAYLLPFWTSLGLIAALKLFVAAFGTYLLGRALGMRFAGALLAGTVFGFSLYLVAWLSFPLSSVWALTPWLLLLTAHVVGQPGPLPAAGLAVVVALQLFAGHPESTFHALLAAVLFLILRLVRARRSGELPGLSKPTVAFGGGLLGGAALAAAVLLPFAELLLHSADLDQRIRYHTKVPARFLAEIVLPTFWGRPTGPSLEGFLHTRAFYAGALPLMLAVAALVLRPALERVAVAAFGLACMAVVVGVPPLFDLVSALPGFRTVHNDRLAVLYVLCVALLAGWGLDELAASRPAADRSRIVRWLALALLCLPITWVAIARPPLSTLVPALDLAWGFGSPPEPLSPAPGWVIHGASLIVWLTMAGAGVALLVLRLRGRLSAAAFAALAVALVVGDLFRAGVGVNPAIDRDIATQPATGAIRYLASQHPARFVGVGLAFYPDLAMRYGLYDARGYDFPIERRYDRLWRREVSPEFPTQTENYGSLATLFRHESPRAYRALSLLGVKHIIQGPDGPPLGERSIRIAYQGPDARVYANPRALPRALVAGEQLVVQGEDAALDAVTRARFDGRRVVVTERVIEGVPAMAEGSRPPAGRARIVEYRPERVVVEAHAARRGALVLTDVHFPGWKATVDGEPVPIERVDYLFRGIPLGPGAHRVEFRYEPASWRIGWIASLLGLLALAAAVLIGWRSRARGGAATS